ncbi:MAG TPA: hypothetical protein VG537_08605 [Candidatus Kapabacteria bacterium]|nr:hypothetical protein [Candidatus Kapabacteria bacterium]
METHWKIHNPPIPFSEWSVCRAGSIPSGMLVRLLLKYKMANGEEIAHERTLLVGDIHNKGVNSYDCECQPTWGTSIRQFRDQDAYPSCFVLAESNALVDLLNGLLKESETLNPSGTQAVFETAWNGDGMQHEVFQIRDDKGQLLVPSRLVNAFPVRVEYPLDYVGAEQAARQLVQELRRGHTPIGGS